MKVWKSPVLYLGILLVVAVFGLMAASVIVDWNAYRADVEAYARKLTGRMVRVEGPITARLFPWPRVTFHDVHVANPAGMAAAEFAQVDTIDMRMTLAGLLRGNFDVESIDIDGAEINFERLESGEVNWRFDLAGHGDELLARVKLDRITVSGATLRFNDHRRGEVRELADFAAAISAPGFAGPWRLRRIEGRSGVADFAGLPIDIDLTTGVWSKGEPFRLGLRVAPAGGVGLAYRFDGAQADAGLAGTLTIEPAATLEASKPGEEGPFPLILTAKVRADFDRVDIATFEIAPRDPRAGGAMATGSAAATLGQRVDLKVAVAASMLDLDSLAGPRAGDLLSRNGGLDLAQGLIDLLPDGLMLSGSARFSALKAGGETFNEVAIDVDADRNALRITRLALGLPGRAQALFKGVYFPGALKSELAGTLAVEANDLRELAGFLLPGWRPALARLWTGSRGRLKLESAIAATASSLRFSQAAYELDGAGGNFELAVSEGGRQAIDLRLNASRLDLDSFLPQGLSLFKEADQQGLMDLAGLVLAKSDMPDVRLTVQAEELLLNGTTANDLALDVAFGGSGLDLRALEIGSVGGARLEATGLVMNSGKGPDGAIGLEVTAGDPRGLLRLLGFIQGESDPAWSLILAPANIRGNLSVKPVAGGQAIALEAVGNAGALSFTGSGRLDERFSLSATAALSAPRSGPLLALAGFEIQGEDLKPGQLAITLTGKPTNGYGLEADLRALGAHVRYAGAIDPAAPAQGLNGTLSLKTTDALTLLEAMGLPIYSIPESVLVADARLANRDGALRLEDITGRSGAAEFRGALAIKPGAVVEGEFEAGELALSDVLAPVFLGWTGAAPGLDAGFAAGLPFGVTGEIWLRPSKLKVHPQFVARDAEIGITAGAGEIRLALFAKDDQGATAGIEVSSKGEGDSREIAGSAHIPVVLDNQLLMVSGEPVASGHGEVSLRFEARGRSPGGALSAMGGTGSYSIGGLKLLGLSPSSFSERLALAKDEAGITAALDQLAHGGSLDFGPVKGTITLSNGVVSFQPFSLSTAEALVEVKSLAELALGEIDLSFDVLLKARPHLPRVTISYAGPPSFLVRSEDNTELATKLGVTIMQEGIAELERLQQEQRRFAEEEERQRIADEERLAAYYAQRDELLLRRRELKIHGEMRLAEAERLRRLLESERAANQDISRSEVKQRQREIKFYRRLGRLSLSEPPAPARTRRKTGPLVLVRPEGAPILISPDPSASPSQ